MSPDPLATRCRRCLSPAGTHCRGLRPNCFHTPRTVDARRAADEAAYRAQAIEAERVAKEKRRNRRAA